jgi:hypothetical protein
MSLTGITKPLGGFVQRSKDCWGRFPLGTSPVLGQLFSPMPPRLASGKPGVWEVGSTIATHCAEPNDEPVPVECVRSGRSIAEVSSPCKTVWSRFNFKAPTAT